MRSRPGARPLSGLTGVGAQLLSRAPPPGQGWGGAGRGCSRSPDPGARSSSAPEPKARPPGVGVSGVVPEPCWPALPPLSAGHYLNSGRRRPTSGASLPPSTGARRAGVRVGPWGVGRAVGSTCGAEGATEERTQPPGQGPLGCVQGGRRDRVPTCSRALAWHCGHLPARVAREGSLREGAGEEGAG